MKKILLSAIAFWLLSQCAIAQTFHAIIVADTDNESIGFSCEVDMIKMTAEFNTIAKTIGYQINTQTVSRGSFRFEEIKAKINNLKCSPDDIVFLYYSGHGYNELESNSKFPIMYLQNDGYPLETALMQIKAKKPRLSIVMGDCCNSIIQKGAVSFRGFVPVCEESNKKTIYKNLFVEPKGEILISSCRKGQTALGSEKYGGFYSYNFLNALQYAVNYGKMVSWNSLLNDATDRLSRMTNTGEQTPQYRLDIGYNTESATITNATIERSEVNFSVINQYMNKLINSKQERKKLLKDYNKYFSQNARVDIYKGQLLIDMKTIEDYLDRIYLNSENIAEINLIEIKSKFDNDEKKYTQITVQEIWKK